MNLSISLNQAVNFSRTLFQIKDAEESEIKARLKQLSQRDRKICFFALNKVSHLQLSDWGVEKPKKEIAQSRLDAISLKIQTLSTKTKKDPAKWYTAPFIALSRVIHSFFLWIRNTFFGRVSSKTLLDKVVAYCQDRHNAKKNIIPGKLENLELLDEAIVEKTQERDDEILNKKLKFLYLEIYRFLLVLRGKEKGESIFRKAVKAAHVKGIDDLSAPQFYQSVLEHFSPLFEKEEDALKNSFVQNRSEIFKPIYDAAKRAKEKELAFSQLLDPPFSLAEQREEMEALIDALFEDPTKKIEEKAAIFENALVQMKFLIKKEKEEEKAAVELLEEFMRSAFETVYIFESAFKKIEEKINDVGNCLYNTVYGREELRDDKKLHLDCLKDYGLKSLEEHKERILAEIELLRKRYLIKI